MSELSEQEETFALHYAHSGNEVEAARLAGYADPVPDGQRLLMTLAVSRRIREMAFCDLDARIGILIRRFSNMTDDTRIPMRDRLLVLKALVAINGNPMKTMQARKAEPATTARPAPAAASIAIRPPLARAAPPQVYAAS